MSENRHRVRTRMRRFFIGICLTSIVVGIILTVKLQNDFKPKHLLDKYNYYFGQNSKEFLINTPSCRIPRTPIWPEFIKMNWKSRKSSYCRFKKTIAHLNDSDQMIRVFPKESGSSWNSCCLREIFLEKDDAKLKLSNCSKITDNIFNVSEMEMLEIKCGNDVNYEANIPIKPIVQSKIHAWKDVTTENVPLSVLIIGIDTTSRSNAYRSIPKTLELMKGMGFHDFLGYHSVAPSTLLTFLAVLMGWRQGSLRKNCAPDWKTPFDTCPFIWKNFSRKDYVTMYMEDGTGALNWGGQAGFHSLPTDYYLYPLFLASGFKSCMSSESVPQFMLRYTKRFIQKFHSIPFFSFSWFAEPFHDDRYALQNLENDTFEFFDSLQSIPGFLERTLVVVLGDHGDRTNFGDSRPGVVAHIERGLPPLFIRFPELLKKRHPELNLNITLEHNVKSLTTPFDLHHTFLHILALDDGKDFESVRPDRQSLLTKIEDRSCETANIALGNCVCNININSTDDQLVNNQYLRYHIIFTVRTELNRIVNSSKYRDVCAKWIVHIHWVSSVQIIDKKENQTDLHVQFSANGFENHRPQGIASFEAKIRMTYNHRNETNEIDKYDFKLIGKIIRVNLYGNQSECVGFETDEDKEMKEFCLCKSQAGINKQPISIGN